MVLACAIALTHTQTHKTVATVARPARPLRAIHSICNLPAGETNTHIAYLSSNSGGDGENMAGAHSHSEEEVLPQNVGVQWKQHEIRFRGMSSVLRSVYLPTSPWLNLPAGLFQRRGEAAVVGAAYFFPSSGLVSPRPRVDTQKTTNRLQQVSERPPPTYRRYGQSREVLRLQLK